jgi:uncharacterized protein
MALGWLKKGLVAAGLLSAGSASAEARLPSSPRPAMWKVADRDTTVYLFGTIHLLPKGYAWRSATFDQAAHQADSLIVETIVDAQNPAELASALMRLGLRDGLPPLEQRVAPGKRAALATAIVRSGVPAAALNRMETWAAAFTLLGTQFRGMDLRQEDGVETVLKQSFRAAGKPIGQLETNAEQLGFFDVLPESAQRSLLEGALERPEAVKKQFDTMLAAWARGDVDAIARTFNAEMSSAPAMRDILLKRRNANWARWIEARMAQPGSVLVAVGAGHLAGTDSVQAMLQKRGLKVTRLQ